MAVTPGTSFRHDNGFITKISDTDFVITDQPVVSRYGKHTGLIRDKTGSQLSISMFRRTHKDHVQPSGNEPRDKIVRFIFRNMDIRIRKLPDKKIK